jgi:UDP-glucuronate decarboxylase
MVGFYNEEDICEIIDRIKIHSNDFSGKTVLLSGGRGFIGRYFIEVFKRLNASVLENPVHVIILDNLITGRIDFTAESSDNNIEFINHDIIKPFQYNGKLDFVIHAAGIASPYYYGAFPMETLDVAITGTRNMLELSEASNARFIFFSSSEIYGDPEPENVPTSEDYRGNVSCQGPRACYDESKRVGETITYIFHTQVGVKTNVIRPFNIFGPGMLENDYRVLPNFASKIKKGLPLQIYGNGSQTRTFCYITDAIFGFLMIILKGGPGEAYNIGNSNPEISMIDLAETIERVISKKLIYHLIDYPDSYPQDEPMRRSPDISKAKTQLGFEPRVKFENGLSKFLAWSNGAYSAK